MEFLDISSFTYDDVVVVVYHVNILAIGHGLLKKFCLELVFYALQEVPLLKTMQNRSYFVRATQLLPHPHLC